MVCLMFSCTVSWIDHSDFERKPESLEKTCKFWRTNSLNKITFRKYMKRGSCPPSQRRKTLSLTSAPHRLTLIFKLISEFCAPCFMHYYVLYTVCRAIITTLSSANIKLIALYFNPVLPKFKVDVLANSYAVRRNGAIRGFVSAK